MLRKVLLCLALALALLAFRNPALARVGSDEEPIDTSSDDSSSVGESTGSTAAPSSDRAGDPEQARAASEPGPSSLGTGGVENVKFLLSGLIAFAGLAGYLFYRQSMFERRSGDRFRRSSAALHGFQSTSRSFGMRLPRQADPGHPKE